MPLGKWVECASRRLCERGAVAQAELVSDTHMQPVFTRSGSIRINKGNPNRQMNQQINRQVDQHNGIVFPVLTGTLPLKLLTKQPATKPANDPVEYDHGIGGLLHTAE